MRASRALAVASLLAALLGGCSPVDGEPSLAILERPSTPNTFLVCPAGHCAAEADEDAPVYAAVPDALYRTVADVVAVQPRTEVVSADAATRRLVAVQRTAVLRFPDTVTIEVLSSGAGSTLAIYSRSAYGYGDFGANEARVRDWLAAIGSAIGPSVR